MTKEWSFSLQHSEFDGNFFEIMLLFGLWISTDFETKGFKWSHKLRARDQVLTHLILDQKLLENSLIMKFKVIRTLWKAFANLRVSDSLLIEANQKQKYHKDFNWNFRLTNDNLNKWIKASQRCSDTTQLKCLKTLNLFTKILFHEIKNQKRFFKNEKSP